LLSARRHITITSAGDSRGWARYVPSLYQVALIAILGAILVVALAPRLDTDLWWHLKVGSYITSQHVVPAHDFMSYTLVGHAWTDHEWLAEILLFALYGAAGLWGPIIFFAALICLTFGLVYLQMTQRGVHRVPALFLVAAAFVASSASWGPRIQMMTLLFLSAFMLVLTRFDATRRRRLLFAFPALMLVWTNVHGGFVLGLVLIFLTLFGEWLNRASGNERSWSRDDLRALGLALAGTIAVTIVNPNGYRQLLYPFTFVLPNAYTNLIEESASPNFHMPVIMVFECLLLLLIASACIGRPRLNWTHLFIAVAFTHLALSQVRNVAVWAVVVTPLVAVYAQSAAPAIKTFFPRLSYRRRPVRGGIAALLNLTLLVLVVVAYLLEATHFINAQALTTAETDSYPAGAVRYMQQHRLPQHVFASYSWGGYLLWKTFPQYRDFMDSRADTLYTATILHAYIQAYTASPGWRDVLRRYQVGTILVERASPLAQVLAESSGWRLAYRDPISVLYQRA
jgi:hypothetical protein